MPAPPTGPDKQSVRVTIFNQTYNIAVSGDPREAEKLAADVDQLMLDMARRTGYGDSLRIAVLACLHLADRLQEAESRVSTIEAQASRLNLQMGELLEDTIAEPDSQ